MNYDINLFKSKISMYISSLIDEDKNILLSKNSNRSPFALCFAIHTLFLIKEKEILNVNKSMWINLLKKNLINTSKIGTQSKSFQQLLSLTISSLIILGEPKCDTVYNYIKSSIPEDISLYLKGIGSHLGRPGSGNMSMFIMIFFIYLEKYYNESFNKQISYWVKFHIHYINKFGFWGDSKQFKYSFFQNGYHQYEIFNYLETDNLPILQIKKNILKIQDEYGHFSSVPGGTGCHDYDAVYFLTYVCNNEDNNEKIAKALGKIRKRIINIQHSNGGFSESLYVRPLNFKNLHKQLKHINFNNRIGRNERLLRFIANLRPKNSNIKNHWSEHKRGWDEANIFNTWFKVLTLAKIEKYLDDNKDWAFLDFPGIGFSNE